MDEIWEKAVEIALDGNREVSSVRNLTLDGTVKCINGRLAPRSVFEKFPNLQHLSIANIGVSSLEEFPRLRNLQKLVLSDNRISGGLECLVEAGLESLRDLDLSNNKIGEVGDLRPLAELRIVSLDLYECPVTRVKDYRARVFGMIKSLKYLDKMDAEENERPESEDEDEDGEEDEEDEDEDPGSGEIDGDVEGGTVRAREGNGHLGASEGVVEVDEDEESDADEELEANGFGGVNHQSNGFVMEPLEDDDEDEEDESEDESEDDVVEVHEIEDSDDDEVVVEDVVVEDADDDEDDDDEDEDDDGDEEEDDEEDEEVDNDNGEPESTGRLASTEGEIDGHEQGEDDADEDDDGETGEEELGVEEGVDFDDDDDEDDAEDEDEDIDTGYLVQPVDHGGLAGGGASGSILEDEDEDGDIVLEDEVEDDDDEDGEVQEVAEPPPPAQKRKRDEEDSSDGDAVESKSSKRRP